jgi:hypothetical protein
MLPRLARWLERAAALAIENLSYALRRWLSRDARPSASTAIGVATLSPVLPGA